MENYYLTALAILASVIGILLPLYFVLHSRQNKEQQKYELQILNLQQKHSQEIANLNRQTSELQSLNAEKEVKFEDDKAKIQKKIINLQDKISQLESEKSALKRDILELQEQLKPKGRQLTIHELPPASASSEPTPDDYHAKRRRLL